MWHDELKEAVKAIILSAHAKDDTDRERIRDNMKLSARPMILAGLTAWMTNRAGPIVESELRGKARPRPDRAANGHQLNYGSSAQAHARAPPP